MRCIISVIASAWLDKGHIETVQEKKEFFANPVTRAAAVFPAAAISYRQNGCQSINWMFRTGESALNWKKKFRKIRHLWACAHIISTCLMDLAEAKNSSVMQTDRLLEQQFESELVLKYSTETDVIANSDG